MRRVATGRQSAASPAFWFLRLFGPVSERTDIRDASGRPGRISLVVAFPGPNADRPASSFGEHVVLRSLRLSAVAAAAFLPGTLTAQESGTTVTLTVSPSFVSFADLGSGPAAVARLSISRGFSRLTGGELSAFVLAPLGGATASPDCVVGGNCQTRSTPSLLSGVSTSVFAFVGETGLRGSIGVGAVGASGGEGLGNRGSFAGLIGLDWLPPTDNRVAPTFSFRLVQLASPIAGARQLLLPGVGLSF